ncbi:MAG TPA: AI-2E family transporter [Xanthobacteraceae bacterium]|nr:AI-2E family transporter [Xanthobacteraceae bacterium]
MKENYFDFLNRTLIVAAVVVTLFLIWYLSSVVLIVFGAIILAMLLRLGAHPLTQGLALPEPIALIVSGLLILFAIAGTGYVFGSHLASEFQDVVRRTVSASNSIEARLQTSSFGQFLLNHFFGGNLALSDVLPSLLKVSANFLEAVVIAIISAAYLAAQPRLYRNGVIWLFPPDKHARAAEIFDGIAEALRLWLLGQLLEMILIGALSTFAVWMIGIPSPLALGLIASIGEFVPYLGPIIAAIPALLVAITKSPDAVLWIALAYFLIHQLESQIVAPLIQRHMVSIPPAVTLLGIVAVTSLFGGVAIIFAAPITVVIFAAVNLLYVRETLGEKTALTRKLADHGRRSHIP